ncbi:DNA polymerase III subunit [Adlercreutzia faecimuris]|uniref:DNA polymerase III subunit n=1 Tax=Adlercreutzia faecimuris TaxID=2897341 RepID=A0ABS9WG18_9ACTN|nr:DNA polymerase III subunit [Adlercreutzia sp. JBNU-10]
MPDAFENILGQPKVREFLRASVASGRVSHAYLFAGPAGSNKTLAAYALAQAVLCPKGPRGPRGGRCGDCTACDRVMRRKHPDVRYFAPEGAAGYLVEQIRELVADTALAPIQGARKVYIIDRADLLGTAAANAFLKTLEEPPADVVIILLGRTRESVLPTIVSRCQVVPFRHIPASEAAGIVRQNTGASLETSRAAIEACGGSITRACEFLRAPGNERLRFRSRVLEVLASLRRADDWDVIGYAAEMVTASKLPLDVVREGQEAELAENADFLAKSAIRQIEARNKRQITAKSAECLRQLTAITASWLRDVLATSAGAPELVINVDARAAVADAAALADEASLARALAAVDRCEEALAYNVSPETCIDVLLFEIREALNGSGSTHQHSL